MTVEPSDEFKNRVGADRIASRQVDELIGLARGFIADGEIALAEVEFLQKWLAANLVIIDQPVLRTLYHRIDGILRDGLVDAEEKVELLETLQQFSGGAFELGEVFKSASLPLDEPQPDLSFVGKRYCFTGTFNFGQRKHCERAIIERGGDAGSLTQKTNVLVIGVYATESWKHSSFGNKIQTACGWRSRGLPIVVVSEPHWVRFL